MFMVRLKGLFFLIFCFCAFSPSGEGEGVKIQVLGPIGGFWSGKKVKIVVSERFLGSQRVLEKDTDPRGQIRFKDYKDLLPKVLFRHGFIKGMGVPIVRITMIGLEGCQVLCASKVVERIDERGSHPLVLLLKKWPLIQKGRLLEESKWNPVSEGRVWLVSAKDPYRPSVGEEWFSLKNIYFYSKKSGFQVFGIAPKPPNLYLASGKNMWGKFFKGNKECSSVHVILGYDGGVFGKKFFEDASKGIPENGMIYKSKPHKSGLRVKVCQGRGKRFVLWRTWDFFGKRKGIYAYFRAGIGLSRLRLNYPGAVFARHYWICRRKKEDETQIGSGSPFVASGGDDTARVNSCADIEADFYKKETGKEEIVLFFKAKTTFYLDDKKSWKVTIKDQIGSWKWVCKKNFKGK